MYDLTDYNVPYDWAAAADRQSRVWDARAIGDYSVDAENMQRLNRLARADTNLRNTLRGINRDEQASLTDYGNFLRKRVEEEQAKPQVSYIDPVSGRNLGVNPFPQSEYTPEQLGLKKVVNGVAQEPQGPIDYAPNNSKDMQIIGRGRDFEKVPKTPMYMHGPGYGDPAFNPWYQVVPDEDNSGKTKLADERAPEYILNRAINPAYYKEVETRKLKLPPQLQPSPPAPSNQEAENPWDTIGEPKEPYSIKDKVSSFATRSNRPFWAVASETFLPTYIAQRGIQAIQPAKKPAKYVYNELFPDKAVIDERMRLGEEAAKKRQEEYSQRHPYIYPAVEYLWNKLF